MSRYLLLLVLITSLVNAASFDCKKASTKIEKKICSDANLSHLDSKLAQTYKDLKTEIKHNQISQYNRNSLMHFFILKQKKWLKNRDKSCKKYKADELKSCLMDHYSTRIEKLKTFSEDASFKYSNFGNVLYRYNHIPFMRGQFKTLLSKEEYAKFLKKYNKWEESYGVCVDKYGVMQEKCTIAVAKKKTEYYEKLLESYKNSKYLVEDGNVTHIERLQKSFLKSYDEEQSEICYSYKYYPQSEYKKLFHIDIKSTKIIPPMAFEDNNSSKNLQTCKADEYRFRVEKSDKIIFINKHLVIFSRDEFSYYGGAHGNYESRYYAFDRDSAKPVLERELALKEGESYLSSMRKILSKEKYEHYFGTKGSVELKAIKPKN